LQFQVLADQPLTQTEQTQLQLLPLPLLQLPQLPASILEATFTNIPQLSQHPSCRGDAKAVKLSQKQLLIIFGNYLT
jgi:hypothetical protein